MSDSHQIELQPDNHGQSEDSVIEVCRTTLIEEDSVFSKIKADLSSSSLLSSSSSGQSQNCKIRKVEPNDRPWENTMSDYTPKIISIGPLHHGKPELQPMEVLKHKYLEKLLKRVPQNDELLGSFIAAARKREEEVRGHYDLSEIYTISSDDFVRMLVIDGCFLIEFLISWNFTRKSDHLGRGRHGPLINQDIQLFENQIPFFVLQMFYEILGEYGYYGRSIFEVAHYYMMENHVTFGFAFSEASFDAFSAYREPKSLLHLHYVRPVSHRSHLPYLLCILCCICCLNVGVFLLCSIMYLILSGIMSNFTSFLYFIYKIFFPDIMYPAELISAMEIEEAGVRLQGSRMDLRFEKGTLTIPVLTLNQESLRLLKNLMVFEFYFRSGRVIPYVHTYVSFLSLLIKNPGDLKVMEKHHIIRASGGGDESFTLVNELIQAGFEELMSGEMPMTDHANFDWQSQFSIMDDLKTYCKERRNRWQAMLMKDYFGNPWTIVGLLTGVILLVLTIIQTVFNVKSYYRQ